MPCAASSNVAYLAKVCQRFRSLLLVAVLLHTQSMESSLEFRFFIFLFLLSYGTAGT